VQSAAWKIIADAAATGRPLVGGAYAPTISRPDGVSASVRLNGESVGTPMARGVTPKADTGAKTSPSVRLTSADVLSIRQRHVAGGVTYHDLLKEFGVHEGTIGRIVRGETWLHLPGFLGRTKTIRRCVPLVPYPTVLNSAQYPF
jgi:hypothetical protein